MVMGEGDPQLSLCSDVTQWKMLPWVAINPFKALALSAFKQEEKAV